MAFRAHISRRLAWLHLPGAMLLALLQRTPAMWCRGTGGLLGARTATAALVRAAAVAATSLAPVQALAGATEFVQSQPNPVRGVVGQPLTVAFTITASPTPPIRFTVNGPLPPGLGTFPAMNGNRILSGTPVITGTPTQAGSFAVPVSGTDGAHGLAHTLIFEIASRPAPAITSQPRSQAVAPGSTVAFNVGAEHAAAFQWRRNGVDLPGATQATLVLRDTGAADVGSYACAITNETGAVQTDVANLRLVAAGEPGRLVQFSLLTELTADAPALNVGLGLGGATGARPLLVRAAGPSLVTLGVARALADPKLELMAGTSVAAANDNWDGEPSLRATFAEVGAFPFADDRSRDAAFLAPALSAGEYSLHVAGAGERFGRVLVEIYDSAPANAADDGPRLRHASFTHRLEAGEMLALGLNVAGATARTFLINAPEVALAVFDAAGTLTAEHAGTDAAFHVTLSPGSWTLQLRATSPGGIVQFGLEEVP